MLEASPKSSLLPLQYANTLNRQTEKQAEGEIERKARVIPDKSLDSCCSLAFPFLLLIAPN